MKKFKLKELVRVFLFLLVVQFIIGLADVLLSQAHSELSSITSLLIAICSYPLSLISSDLPFYVSESILMVILYWIINLMIQAVILYIMLIVVKKMRESK
ncbi:hypothetical protein KO504_00645 [Winogradskyella psychrotolerans]|uniref:Uncharacterized protein n=1 Tax=Winogradskyella damuponensis TaxID=943939 RepID=A0ABP8CXI8_9FLAO|nr:hypothetical protein [Winogradskyella psychrotolerans]MBU2919835.1 hypothetical protein [Winogradskyella psychrotolerans]